MLIKLLFGIFALFFLVIHTYLEVKVVVIQVRELHLHIYVCTKKFYLQAWSTDIFKIIWILLCCRFTELFIVLVLDDKRTNRNPVELMELPVSYSRDVTDKILRNGILNMHLGCLRIPLLGSICDVTFLTVKKRTKFKNTYIVYYIRLFTIWTNVSNFNLNPYTISILRSCWTASI